MVNNNVTLTRAQPANDNGRGLSIRGSASNQGPFVVVAQNFQPGTTSGDIQNAMAVDKEMPYCKIVANNPTVICEMAFAHHEDALQVVETYNGQKVRGFAWRTMPYRLCINFI